jgi:hypothetical protein
LRPELQKGWEEITFPAFLAFVSPAKAAVPDRRLTGQQAFLSGEGRESSGAKFYKQ